MCLLLNPLRMGCNKTLYLPTWQHLQTAQQRQKEYADTGRRLAPFSIGDEVLLSSKNIRIKHTGTPKLLPKWLGPFTILDHASHHRLREGEPGYSDSEAGIIQAGPA
jgi:hypothetical protein